MIKRINLPYLICLAGLFIFFGVGLAFADRNTPINLDFQGADLRDVFRILAQVAEVNLLTHQSVQGELTLTLKGVPFADAIRLITLINDLDYHWVGNTLLIAEPVKIAENFFTTNLAVFSIQYAELGKIKEIMESLLVESFIQVDERTRKLVVLGKNEDIQSAERLLSALDAPIPQVFLQVQIIELSSSGLIKFGSKQNSLLELQLKSLTDAPIDVALTLPQFVEYLTEEGLAKTLANPGLVTVDGQTSKLLIGDKVPIKAEEEIDGESKTVIKYVDAGIKLEFTPRIASDNYITLQIKPQISSFGEYLTQGYPLIRSREFETVVRIHDGETFVLGGLIREEDRFSLEKVPFLGDIPLINALFKHDEKTRQTTEIVILITPQIIYPGEKHPVVFDDAQLIEEPESSHQLVNPLRKLAPHPIE